jgi:glycosyltransferase involved in cell wall biosynthesis
MLVSVILPTYNRSKLLKRSIESVLCQSFTDYELIIVDDCSKDDTSQIVSQFKDERIKYIKIDKNSGGSLIPRKVGFKYSSGKYIATLDDDDYWLDKSKLGLQVFYFENHPECVLIGTDAIAVNGNGSILARHHYAKSFDEIKEKMFVLNCFFHSSVMYKKETFLNIGGYPIIEDGCYSNFANEYDLWLKMGTIGELINLPIYGVGYTYSYKQMSFKARMGLMLLTMRTRSKYKKYYPHYLRDGIIFNFILTMFELPLLIKIKRIIRGY